MKLKNYLLFFIFLILGAVILIFYKITQPKVLGKQVVNPKINQIKKEIKINAPLPSQIVLEVPFICQAPFANWQIHEDSCEEAAILMNYAYLEKKSLTNEYADQEMLRMRNWQKEHYGQEKDLTCADGVRFVRDYYGYKNSQSLENISELDIKREIAKGNLVIVPVMTHSLLNPHYGPKNVYHFVLIKGYNQAGVITNDAGVKEGENYFYPWEVILSAIDAQKSKTGQNRCLLVIRK